MSKSAKVVLDARQSRKKVFRRRTLIRLHMELDLSFLRPKVTLLLGELLGPINQLMDLLPLIFVCSLF